MSTLPLWGYAVVLTSSLVLSLVLVPVALAVAVRFGLLDHPGPAKAHAEAVPYLGGAAIVASFALVVVVGNVADPPPSGLDQLAGFLGLGVLLAVVGLVDDLGKGLSPWLRLLIETGAAVGVWWLGISPHLAGAPRPADAVVTVVWVVGITNAFNLLDNMDGLSGGVAVVTTLAIFGVALLQHRYLVSALALALAGCAAGFLRANFHPAKIYMGDAGSLFLGFVLAVLLLKLRANAPTRVPLAVIIRDTRRCHLRHDTRNGLPTSSPPQSVPRRSRPYEPPARTSGNVRPCGGDDDLWRWSRSRWFRVVDVAARTIRAHRRRSRFTRSCRHRRHPAVEGARLRPPKTHRSRAETRRSPAEYGKRPDGQRLETATSSKCSFCSRSPDYEEIESFGPSDLSSDN